MRMIFIKQVAGQVGRGDKMPNKYALPYGTISETKDTILYEIPKAMTNLLEPEQLEELKRSDSLFFECHHYSVDEKFVRLHYKRVEGYQHLNDLNELSDKLRNKIAANLIQCEKFIGSQYTLLLHPNNIYVNEEGKVKFAHRGIRSVLPPQAASEEGLLEEIKYLLYFLYSNKSFEELQHVDLYKLSFKYPVIKDIQAASIIQDLVPIVRDKNKFHLSKHADYQKISKRKKKLSALSAILIGILCGMLLLYVFQVVPQSKATATLQLDYDQHQVAFEQEKERMQQQIDEGKLIADGYRFAWKGKEAQAIDVFEQVVSPNKAVQETLTDLYFRSNTIEHLLKASDISPEQHELIVQKLVAYNNKQANDAILMMKSDKEAVLIEQAWLKNDYDRVLALFPTLSDNNRAKLLAAQSFLQVERINEAKKLAKQLRDKGLQIAVLQKEIELVKANKELTKEEKEKQLKKLDDEIKALDK